jgi:hypothetical protein
LLCQAIPKNIRKINLGNVSVRLRLQQLARFHAKSFSDFFKTYSGRRFLRSFNIAQEGFAHFSQHRKLFLSQFLFLANKPNIVPDDLLNSHFFKISGICLIGQSSIEEQLPLSRTGKCRIFVFRLMKNHEEIWGRRCNYFRLPRFFIMRTF